MQHNGFFARKATMDDLPALLRFEQGVIAAERPFDETLREGEIHYYDLKWLIESPDAELLVIEEGRRLIASGYARKENAKAYLKFNQFAYLGFMYVVPEFRGRRLIQIIINGLKEWAIANGLTELRLDVYSDNDAAINAYEKMGFKKLLVEMRLGNDEW